MSNTDEEIIVTVINCEGSHICLKMLGMSKGQMDELVGQLDPCGIGCSFQYTVPYMYSILLSMLQTEHPLLNWCERIIETGLVDSNESRVKLERVYRILESYYDYSGMFSIQDDDMDGVDTTIGDIIKYKPTIGRIGLSVSDISTLSKLTSTLAVAMQKTMSLNVEDIDNKHLLPISSSAVYECKVTQSNSANRLPEASVIKVTVCNVNIRSCMTIVDALELQYTDYPHVGVIQYMYEMIIESYNSKESTDAKWIKLLRDSNIVGKDIVTHDIKNIFNKLLAVARVTGDDHLSKHDIGRLIVDESEFQYIMTDLTLSLTFKSIDKIKELVTTGVEKDISMGILKTLYDMEDTVSNYSMKRPAMDV